MVFGWSATQPPVPRQGLESNITGKTELAEATAAMLSPPMSVQDVLAYSKANTIKNYKPYTVLKINGKESTKEKIEKIDKLLVGLDARVGADGGCWKKFEYPRRECLARRMCNKDSESSGAMYVMNDDVSVATGNIKTYEMNQDLENYYEGQVFEKENNLGEDSVIPLDVLFDWWEEEHLEVMWAKFSIMNGVLHIEESVNLFGMEETWYGGVLNHLGETVYWDDSWVNMLDFYKVWNSEKDRTNKFLVGVNPEFFLRNKFFDRLDFDNLPGHIYLSAVDDHDKRVVNNNFSSFNFFHVVTTMPSKKIKNGCYTEMQNMIFMPHKASIEDEDLGFLLDVSTMYAYNNCDRNDFAVNDSLAARLHKQPWFDMPAKDSKKILITDAPTLEDVLKYEFVYYITAKIGHDTQGELPYGVGTYRWVNKEAKWAFSNTSKVFSCGIFSECCAGKNYVNIKDLTVHVAARKQIDALQVVVLTALPISHTRLNVDDERTFEIPVFEGKLMAALKLPIIKTVHHNLNKDLLQKLMNLNINNKCTDEFLMNYGAALSWYSYSKRGVEISSHQITPLDVKIHVYVAKVLTQRAGMQKWCNDNLLQIGWPRLLTALFSAFVKEGLSKLMPLKEIPKILKDMIEALKGPQIRDKFGNYMSNWASIDIWSMRNDIVKVEHHGIICKHHTMCLGEFTNKACACCNALNATESGWCVHCAPAGVDCPHELLDVEEGDKTCRCCNRSNESEVCVDCLVIKMLKKEETSQEFETLAEQTTAKDVGKKKTADKKKHQQPQRDKNEIFDFLGKKARSAVEPCVGDGKKHTHKCCLCNKYYEHTHKYNSDMHPLFVGDCPHCENNTVSKKINKPTNNVEEIVEPQHDTANPQAVEKREAEFELNISECRRLLSTMEVNILLNEKFTPYGINQGSYMMSPLPFICVNHPIEPVANFIITDVLMVTGVDCGVSCLQTYVGSEFSENMLKKRTKKTRGLNTDDLASELNAYGFNALILTSFGGFSKRVNDSNNFCCIGHSSVTGKGDDVNHWQPITVERAATSDIEQYSYVMCQINDHEVMAGQMFKQPYGKLTNNEKLQVGTTLATRIASLTSTNYEKLTMTNTGLLTNNKNAKNNLKDGEIAVQIPSQYTQSVAICLRAIESQRTEDLLNKVWNVDQDQTANVEHNVEMNVNDLLFGLTKLFSDPVSMCRSVMVTAVKHTKGLRVDVSNTKLKTGDVVFTVGDKNQYVPHTVKITGRECILGVVSTVATTTVRILVPKNSYWSMLLRLSSLLMVSVSTERLLELIKSAKVIKGYGGTGKTEDLVEIVKNEKDDIACIACTSGGVKSMSQRLPQSVMTILSFEKASYNELTQPTKVVDEAVLLKPWELALVVNNNTKKVIIMGDPTQIGVMDLNESGGRRVMLSLMDFAWNVASDKTNKTESYRYGPTLCQELSKHRKLTDLTSKAKHDTTFELIQIPAWNSDTLIRFMNQADQIIVFYQTHLNKIRSMMANNKKKLGIMSTVHGYQGNESDTICVIQAPIEGSTATTHLDVGQTISAATRARKHLIWISIGCFNESTTLSNRLGGAIGAFDPISASTDDSVDLSQFNHAEFAKTVGNHTKIVKTKFSVTEKGWNIELSALGSKEVVVCENNELKIPDNLMRYRDNIVSAINSSCIGAEKQEDKVYILDVDQVYKVKILSYVTKIYVANHKVMKLKGRLQGYTVEVPGNCCAACSGLNFIRNGKVVCNITEDYLKNDRRTVTGSEAWKIVEVIQSEVDWIDERFVDNNFSLAILAERFDTALKDIGQASITYKRAMHYDRYKNELLAEQIERDLGFRPILTNYDQCALYPFVKHKVAHWKSSFIQDGVRKLKKTFKKPSFKTLIYESLCMLHEKYKNHQVKMLAAKAYENMIGAIDTSYDRVPGMVESLDWHAKHKTGTYSNLLDRVSKLKVSAMKGEAKMVFLPDNAYKYLKKFDLDKQFTTNLMPTMTDGPTNAMDVLFLSMINAEFGNDNVDHYSDTNFANYSVGHIGYSSHYRWSENSLLQHKLNDGYLNNITKTHLKNLPVDHPDYIRISDLLEQKDPYKQPCNNGILALGPRFLEKNPKYWLELTQYNTIISWLPNQCSWDNGNRIMHLEDSSTYYPLSEEWYNVIYKGKEVRSGSLQAIFHTMKICGETRIIKMERNSQEWFDPHLSNDSWIEIEMPKITIDPIELLNTKDLLTVEKYTVNANVLMNLRRRLLLDGTTPDDLLVHARTLLNANQFTTSSVSKRYDMTFSNLMTTVNAALAIHELENYRLGLLEHGGLPEHFKMVLKNIIGKVSVVLGQSINVEEILDMLSEHGFDNIVSMIDPIMTQLNKIKCQPMAWDREYHSVDKSPFKLLDCLQTFRKYFDEAKLGYNVIKRREFRFFVDYTCSNCEDKHVAELLSNAGYKVTKVSHSWLPNVVHTLGCKVHKFYYGKIYGDDKFPAMRHRLERGHKNLRKTRYNLPLIEPIGGAFEVLLTQDIEYRHSYTKSELRVKDLSWDVLNVIDNAIDCVLHLTHDQSSQIELPDSWFNTNILYIDGAKTGIIKKHSHANGMDFNSLNYNEKLLDLEALQNIINQWSLGPSWNQANENNDLEEMYRSSADSMLDYFHRSEFDFGRRRKYEQKYSGDLIYNEYGFTTTASPDQYAFKHIIPVCYDSSETNENGLRVLTTRNSNKPSSVCFVDREVREIGAKMLCKEFENTPSVHEHTTATHGLIDYWPIYLLPAYTVKSKGFVYWCPTHHVVMCTETEQLCIACPLMDELILIASPKGTCNQFNKKLTFSVMTGSSDVAQDILPKMEEQLSSKEETDYNSAAYDVLYYRTNNNPTEGDWAISYDESMPKSADEPLELQMHQEVSPTEKPLQKEEPKKIEYTQLLDPRGLEINVDEPELVDYKEEEIRNSTPDDNLSKYLNNILKPRYTSQKLWFEDELANQREEIHELFSNPLVKGRLSLGRDLTSKNTHMVSELFTHNPKVTPFTIKWLRYLRKTFDDIIGDEELIHVTSLKRGVIERAPLAAGFSLNIGMEPKTKGWTTLRLDNDPGRFGACLRLICAVMTRKQAIIHPTSGRPGLHVMWAEYAINELFEEKAILENTVVMPWCNIGPFLDGMLLCKKPTPHNAAQMVSCMLHYRDVYGIDEAKIEWFNLQKAYVNRATGLTYSTLRAENIITDDYAHVAVVNLEGEKRCPTISDEDLIASLRNPEDTWSKAQMLDPCLTMNSREKTAESAGKITKIKQKPITEIGLADADVFYYGSVTPLGKMMLQHDQADCVKTCIFFVLAKQNVAFDPDIMYNKLKLKPYMTEKETLEALYLSGLAFGYTSPTVNICVGNFRSGDVVKVPCFKVTENLDCSMHMEVYEDFDVDENRTMRLTNQDFGKVKELAMNESSNKHEVEVLQQWLNNEYLEDVPIELEHLSGLRNAYFRVRGELHQIALTHNVCAYNGEMQGNPVTGQIVTQVPAGAVVIVKVNYDDPSELQACVVAKTDQKYNVIQVKPGFTEYFPFVIDTRSRIRRKIMARIPKTLEKEKDGWTFLTLNDKRFATTHSHTLSANAVDYKNDRLMFQNFDNTDHHMLSRSVVLEKLPKRIKIIQGIDYTEDVRQVLSLSYPLRCEIKNGQLGVRLVLTHSYKEIENSIFKINNDIKVMTAPQQLLSTILSYIETWRLHDWELQNHRYKLKIDQEKWMRDLQELSTDEEGDNSNVNSVRLIYGGDLRTFSSRLGIILDDTIMEDTKYTISYKTYNIPNYVNAKIGNQIFCADAWVIFELHHVGHGKDPLIEAITVDDLKDHGLTVDEKGVSMMNRKKDRVVLVTNKNWYDKLESQLKSYNLRKIQVRGPDYKLNYNEEVILTMGDKNPHNTKLFKGTEEDRFKKIMNLDLHYAGDEKLDDANKANVRSLMTLNDDRFEDASDHYIECKGFGGANLILKGGGVQDNVFHNDVIEEVIPANIINYWDDEHAMLPGTMVLPNNKMVGFSNNAEFTNIKRVGKNTMTRYPMYSQPNYPQFMSAGFNAVSELWGGKISLRTVEHSAIEDSKRFCETYFKEGSLTALQPVNIDPEAILEWLKERPDFVKVSADLEQVISQSFSIKGMQNVNIHMKLESRMKDVADLMTNESTNNGMPETMNEQRVRLIVWQRKGITTIFSAFFKQIKDNLKRCMRSDVVYVDGMTPQQISAMLNKINGDVVFAEDDLKKQDRQTDQVLIDTEMEIYKMLGGNPNVVKLWSTVHEYWRAKGMGIRFEGSGSRHTGQATTSLGNTLVNLIVKERLVRDMGSRLKIMLVLGDDNIIICSPGITAKDISTNSANHFNMQSEPSVSNVVGGFLRMIVYKNSMGNIESGPDLIRLARRYEVTNGVSEANDQNIHARTMSYLMMIGDQPETRKICKEKQYDLNLGHWYETSSLLTVLADKYKCTPEKVNTIYNRLIKMMSEQTVYTNYKLMFTEKGT